MTRLFTGALIFALSPLRRNFFSLHDQKCFRPGDRSSESIYAHFCSAILPPYPGTLWHTLAQHEQSMSEIRIVGRPILTGISGVFVVFLKILFARPAGLEPATLCLEGGFVSLLLVGNQRISTSFRRFSATFRTKSLPILLF